MIGKTFKYRKWFPYLSIWARPKRTVKRIIEEDPNFGVMALGILVGITASLRSSILNGLHPLPDLIGHNPMLDDIISIGIGKSPGMIMTSASIIVYGSVMGVALVLIGSLLLKVGGKISGGHGLYKPVRTAVAWSFAPYTMLLPLWVLIALLKSGELRQVAESTGAITDIGFYIPLMIFVDSAIRILCLAYLIISLTDVHKITPARSVALVVLAFVPLTLVLIPWQGLPFNW